MQMEEKIYKSMGRSGALSIAVGVVAIVTGVASGVLFTDQRSQTVSEQK